MIEITLLLDRELEDGSVEKVEVTVRGKYHIGDTPESEEVEIHSSTLIDGTPWKLTQSQQHEAESKIVAETNDYGPIG